MCYTYVYIHELGTKIWVPTCFIDIDNNHKLTPTQVIGSGQELNQNGLPRFCRPLITNDGVCICGPVLPYPYVKMCLLMINECLSSLIKVHCDERSDYTKPDLHHH